MRPKWLLLVAFSISAGVFSGAFSAIAAAQDGTEIKKSGYVTDVSGPNEFALNRQQVLTYNTTTYQLMGQGKDKKSSDTAEIVRHAVQIGAYLEVKGKLDASHVLRVSQVLVRDDWEKQLSGAGIIEKVIDVGVEPVFQADGYKIRITSATEVSLSDKMKSISDAGPGFWIRYKGMRDAGGVLVAKKARIVPGKISWLGPMSSAQGEKAPRQLDVPRGGALLDVNGNLVSPNTQLDERDAGGSCGWYKVPADAALQNRIQNVGVRVVPAYLMKLDDSDKPKIHFRFYVVEEEKIRSELTCIPGLILVPRKVMERLENDDQLAALLADGVAWNLQQLVSAAMENKENAALASMAFGSVSLAAKAGILAGGAVLGHKMDESIEDERDRIALELMADGGYDPWQAPEAWRLLAEKKPPKLLQPIVYPDRSGYQLSILNLQYGERKAIARPAAF